VLDRLTDRWFPDRWPSDRAIGPPRRRLAVLAASGVLIGIVLALGFTLSGSPDTPELPPALPAALPAASVSEARNPSSANTPGDDAIVISVVGRVATPGLVTLPDGARVADALEAAGDPVPGADLGSLNLARRLSDGEQLYVGVPTPPGAELPAAPHSGQPGAAPVDLNSASSAALDTLPGVGPVTAQRILDWRTQHGRFASVEQLREIEGIGPSRFDKLKDLVVAR